MGKKFNKIPELSSAEDFNRSSLGSKTSQSVPPSSKRTFSAPNKKAAHKKETRSKSAAVKNDHDGEYSDDFSECSSTNSVCEGENETQKNEKLKTPVPTPRQNIDNKNVPEYEYLQFSLRITEDIIRNDLYTNREMQRVFSSHVEANRGRLSMKKMLVHIDQLCTELNNAKRTTPRNICSCPLTVHESIKKVEEQRKMNKDKSHKDEIVNKIIAGEKIITDEEIKQLSEVELQEVISELLKTHEDNTKVNSSSKTCICGNCFNSELPVCRQILTNEFKEMSVEEVKECNNMCKCESCASGDTEQKGQGEKCVKCNELSNACMCGEPVRTSLAKYMSEEVARSSSNEVNCYTESNNVLETNSIGEFDVNEVLKDLSVRSSLLSLTSQDQFEEGSIKKFDIEEYLKRQFPISGVVDACSQTSLDFESFAFPSGDAFEPVLEAKSVSEPDSPEIHDSVYESRILEIQSLLSEAKSLRDEFILDSRDTLSNKSAVSKEVSLEARSLYVEGNNEHVAKEPDIIVHSGDGEIRGPWSELRKEPNVRCELFADKINGDESNKKYVLETPMDGSSTLTKKFDVIFDEKNKVFFSLPNCLKDINITTLNDYIVSPQILTVNTLLSDPGGSGNQPDNDSISTDSSLSEKAEIENMEKSSTSDKISLKKKKVTIKDKVNNTENETVEITFVEAESSQENISQDLNLVVSERKSCIKSSKSSRSIGNHSRKSVDFHPDFLDQNKNYKPMSLERLPESFKRLSKSKDSSESVQKHVHGLEDAENENPASSVRNSNSFSRGFGTSSRKSVEFHPEFLIQNPSHKPLSLEKFPGILLNDMEEMDSDASSSSSSTTSKKPNSNEERSEETEDNVELNEEQNTTDEPETQNQEKKTNNEKNDSCNTFLYHLGAHLESSDVPENGFSCSGSNPIAGVNIKNETVDSDDKIDLTGKYKKIDFVMNLIKNVISEKDPQKNLINPQKTVTCNKLDDVQPATSKKNSSERKSSNSEDNNVPKKLDSQNGNRRNFLIARRRNLVKKNGISSRRNSVKNKRNSSQYNSITPVCNSKLKNKTLIQRKTEVQSKETVDKLTDKVTGNKNKKREIDVSKKETVLQTKDNDGVITVVGGKTTEETKKVVETFEDAQWKTISKTTSRKTISEWAAVDEIPNLYLLDKLNDSDTEKKYTELSNGLALEYGSLTTLNSQDMPINTSEEQSKEIEGNENEYEINKLEAQNEIEKPNENSNVENEVKYQLAQNEMRLKTVVLSNESIQDGNIIEVKNLSAQNEIERPEIKKLSKGRIETENYNEEYIGVGKIESQNDVESSKTKQNNEKFEIQNYGKETIIEITKDKSAQKDVEMTQISTQFNVKTDVKNDKREIKKCESTQNETEGPNVSTQNIEITENYEEISDIKTDSVQNEKKNSKSDVLQDGSTLNISNHEETPQDFSKKSDKLLITSLNGKTYLKEDILKNISPDTVIEATHKISAINIAVQPHSDSADEVITGRKNVEEIIEKLKPNQLEEEELVSSEDGPKSSDVEADKWLREQADSKIQELFPTEDQSDKEKENGQEISELTDEVTMKLSDDEIKTEFFVPMGNFPIEKNIRDISMSETKELYKNPWPVNENQVIEPMPQAEIQHDEYISEAKEKYAAPNTDAYVLKNVQGKNVTRKENAMSSQGLDEYKLENKISTEIKPCDRCDPELEEAHQISVVSLEDTQQNFASEFFDNEDITTVIKSPSRDWFKIVSPPPIVIEEANQISIIPENLQQIGTQVSVIQENKREIQPSEIKVRSQENTTGQIENTEENQSKIMNGIPIQKEPVGNVEEMAKKSTSKDFVALDEVSDETEEQKTEFSGETIHEEDLRIIGLHVTIGRGTEDPHRKSIDSGTTEEHKQTFENVPEKKRVSPNPGTSIEVDKKSTRQKTKRRSATSQDDVSNKYVLSTQGSSITRKMKAVPPLGLKITVKKLQSPEELKISFRFPSMSKRRLVRNKNMQTMPIKQRDKFQETKNGKKNSMDSQNSSKSGTEFHGSDKTAEDSINDSTKENSNEEKESRTITRSFYISSPTEDKEERNSAETRLKNLNANVRSLHEDDVTFGKYLQAVEKNHEVVLGDIIYGVTEHKTDDASFLIYPLRSKLTTQSSDEEPKQKETNNEPEEPCCSPQACERPVSNQSSTSSGHSQFKRNSRSLSKDSVELMKCVYHSKQSLNFKQDQLEETLEPSESRHLRFSVPTVVVTTEKHKVPSLVDTVSKETKSILKSNTSDPSSYTEQIIPASDECCINITNQTDSVILNTCHLQDTYETDTIQTQDEQDMQKFLDINLQDGICQNTNTKTVDRHISGCFLTNEQFLSQKQTVTTEVTTEFSLPTDDNLVSSTKMTKCVSSFDTQVTRVSPLDETVVATKSEVDKKVVGDLTEDTTTRVKKTTSYPGIHTQKVARDFLIDENLITTKSGDDKKVVRDLTENENVLTTTKVKMTSSYPGTDTQVTRNSSIDENVIITKSEVDKKVVGDLVEDDTVVTTTRVKTTTSYPGTYTQKVTRDSSIDKNIIATKSEVDKRVVREPPVEETVTMTRVKMTTSYPSVITVTNSPKDETLIATNKAKLTSSDIGKIVRVSPTDDTLLTTKMNTTSFPNLDTQKITQETFVTTEVKLTMSYSSLDNQTRRDLLKDNTLLPTEVTMSSLDTKFLRDSQMETLTNEAEVQDESIDMNVTKVVDEQDWPKYIAPEDGMYQSSFTRTIVIKPVDSKSAVSSMVEPYSQDEIMVSESCGVGTENNQDLSLEKITTTKVKETKISDHGNENLRDSINEAATTSIKETTKFSDHDKKDLMDSPVDEIVTSRIRKETTEFSDHGKVDLQDSSIDKALTTTTRMQEMTQSKKEKEKSTSTTKRGTGEIYHGKDLHNTSINVTTTIKETTEFSDDDKNLLDSPIEKVVTSKIGDDTTEITGYGTDDFHGPSIDETVTTTKKKTTDTNVDKKDLQIDEIVTSTIKKETIENFGPDNKILQDSSKVEDLTNTSRARETKESSQLDKKDLLISSVDGTVVTTNQKESTKSSIVDDLLESAVDESVTSTVRKETTETAGFVKKDSRDTRVHEAIIAGARKETSDFSKKDLDSPMNENITTTIKETDISGHAEKDLLGSSLSETVTTKSAVSSTKTSDLGKKNDLQEAKHSETITTDRVKETYTFDFNKNASMDENRMKTETPDHDKKKYLDLLKDETVGSTTKIKQTTISDINENSPLTETVTRAKKTSSERSKKDSRDFPQGELVSNTIRLKEATISYINKDLENPPLSDIGTRFPDRSKKNLRDSPQGESISNMIRVKEVTEIHGHGKKKELRNSLKGETGQDRVKDITEPPGHGEKETLQNNKDGFDIKDLLDSQPGENLGVEKTKSPGKKKDDSSVDDTFTKARREISDFSKDVEDPSLSESVTTKKTSRRGKRDLQDTKIEISDLTKDAEEPFLGESLTTKKKTSGRGKRDLRDSTQGETGKSKNATERKQRNTLEGNNVTNLTRVEKSMHILDFGEDLSGPSQMETFRESPQEQTITRIKSKSVTGISNKQRISLEGKTVTALAKDLGVSSAVETTKRMEASKTPERGKKDSSNTAKDEIALATTVQKTVKIPGSGKKKDLKDLTKDGIDTITVKTKQKATTSQAKKDSLKGDNLLKTPESILRKIEQKDKSFENSVEVEEIKDSSSDLSLNELIEYTDAVKFREPNQVDDIFFWKNSICPVKLLTCPPKGIMKKQATNIPKYTGVKKQAPYICKRVRYRPSKVAYYAPANIRNCLHCGRNHVMKTCPHRDVSYYSQMVLPTHCCRCTPRHITQGNVNHCISKVGKTALDKKYNLPCVNFINLPKILKHIPVTVNSCVRSTCKATSVPLSATPMKHICKKSKSQQNSFLQQTSGLCYQHDNKSTSLESARYFCHNMTASDLSENFQKFYKPTKSCSQETFIYMNKKKLNSTLSLTDPYLQQRLFQKIENSSLNPSFNINDPRLPICGMVAPGKIDCGTTMDGYTNHLDSLQAQYSVDIENQRGESFSASIYFLKSLDMVNIRIPALLPRVIQSDTTQTNIELHEIEKNLN